MYNFVERVAFVVFLIEYFDKRIFYGLTILLN